jgi:hypothetical protein
MYRTAAPSHAANKVDVRYGQKCVYVIFDVQVTLHLEFIIDLSSVCPTYQTDEHYTVQINSSGGDKATVDLSKKDDAQY